MSLESPVDTTYVILWTGSPQWGNGGVGGGGWQRGVGGGGGGWGWQRGVGGVEVSLQKKVFFEGAPLVNG